MIVETENLNKDDKKILTECLSDNDLILDLIAFYKTMSLYSGDFDTPSEVIEYLQESRDPTDTFGEFGYGMLNHIFKNENSIVPNK